ncbi:MAG TPA: response regulator [bacterium]|nr:response regulator [bacterium]
MKILIVDDKKENLYLLEILLQGKGFETATAKNGKEALEKLRAGEYGMIISDIMMPVMDGFQLCRECKRDDSLKNITFVFYTATYTEKKDEEFALSLGADRFIIKPTEPDRFIEIVEELVKEHKEGGIEHRALQDIDDYELYKTYSERLVRKLEKKMQELEESEERFRTLLLSLEDIVWAASADGKELFYINKAAENIYGRQARDFFDNTNLWNEIVHPDDRERARESAGALIETGSKNIEYRIVRPDGEIRWLRDRTNVIYDDDGVPVRIGGIATDITKQKDVEKELELNVIRTQALLDLHLMAGDTESRILDFTLEAGLKISQSKIAFIGLIDEAEYVMTIHKWSDNVMKQCAVDGKPIVYPISESGLWGDCIRFRKPVLVNDYDVAQPGYRGLPEGHVSIKRFLEVPVFDGSHITAVIAVANREHDYTERDVVALTSLANKAWNVISRKRAEEALKNSEKQLQQSQKMEAVGRLAGGIAHDFNNMLTVIINYAEFVIEELGGDNPLRPDMEEILKAGNRATALTRQLLAFSRKQPLVPKVFDINRAIEDIEQMLKRLIGEDIDLLIVPTREPVRIKADPGQIEQVIMNLVINSRDAMRKGGKLTIETSNIELGEEYAADHPEVSPGWYVMFSVTDTGMGMDEKTRERIFEPFFTTKESGRGTGLGLSTVYGIVKQSGGFIWVYSEPGKGTTFKIYLPRELSGEETKELESKRAGSAEGTETILVIEDERGVLNLVKRILEPLGYDVQTASDINEAFSVFERFADSIQLIITDIIMPEMSGLVLFAQLTKKYPAIKVLYMSGYTEEAIVHGGVLDRGVNFISKPFSQTDLIEKVRSILDG